MGIIEIGLTHRTFDGAKVEGSVEMEKGRDDGMRDGGTWRDSEDVGQIRLPSLFVSSSNPKRFGAIVLVDLMHHPNSIYKRTP